MKYEEFKKIVIDNMPENPIPGLWQGKGAPRKHILGNPKTSAEKAELINKYSLLPNVSPIDYKTIHLHQYAHHLNSSQIMCYNFFRPMMDAFDGKMYKPLQCLLDLIGMEIDKEINSNDAICNFEYIDGTNEKTNFDFYLKSKNIEVYCEIKYTEDKFEILSKAKDYLEQYQTVYKPMIEKAKEIFIDGTISETDFNTKYYQLVRNAIRATSPDKHVFFICPKAHEALIQQFNDFSDNCLTHEGKNRVKLITWEDIVQDAYRLGINIEEFNMRYLAFMP